VVEANARFPSRTRQHSPGHLRSTLNGFRWDLLLMRRTGPAQPASTHQFLASERRSKSGDTYALSVLGSNWYRLKTNKTGFNNVAHLRRLDRLRAHNWLR